MRVSQYKIIFLTQIHIAKANETYLIKLSMLELNYFIFILQKC